MMMNKYFVLEYDPEDNSNFDNFAVHHYSDLKKAKDKAHEMADLGVEHIMVYEGQPKFKVERKVTVDWREYE